MGLALKLNFVKGWPNPAIHEVATVAADAANYAKIDEGKIGFLDANGKWVIQASAADKLPYVLWNGAAKDGDHGAPYNKDKHYAQVPWGGIQGISFLNAIEFETAQFDEVVALTVGAKLSVTADGLLTASAGVAVAILTKLPHNMAAGVPGTATSSSSLRAITVVPLP